MTFNDVNLRSGVQVLHHSMAATKEFSPYALKPKKVPGQVKLIAGLDPFQLASNPDCGAATRDLSLVRASDIVLYLVLQTSFIIEYL